MMPRRILATLTALISTLTLVAAVLIAAPAANATTALNGGSFVAYPNESVRPVAAISADGQRVIAAINTGSTVDACSPGVEKIEVRGGTVSSTGVTWANSGVYIRDAIGQSCGVVSQKQVFLSDDGTSGMVTWVTAVAGISSYVIRVASISWPLDQDWPTVIDDNVQFASNTTDLHAPQLAAALSADGSRAIVEWQHQFEPSDRRMLKYSVIDMDYLPGARAQVVPGGMVGFALDVPPAVAISANGDLIAFTSRGGPEEISSDGSYRNIFVHTCSVNCNPARLKTFQALMPAGKGALDSRISLSMNQAGTRLLVSWVQTTGKARALAVLVPSGVAGAVTFTNQVSVWTGIQAVAGSIALNDAGTKIASIGEKQNTDTSFYDAVTTADVAANLGLTNVKTVFVYPGSAYGQTERQSLKFVNAIPGAPERLVLSSWTQANNGQVSETVLVSNASSAPTIWATPYSTVIMGDQQFGADDSFGFLVARSALKYLMYSSSTNATDASVPLNSLTVGNLLGVLSPTKLPKLSGSATIGGTVTLDPGTWGAGATVTNDWTYGDGPLDSPNATNTFRPTLESELGRTVVAHLTVSRSGYYTEHITTAPTAAISGMQAQINIALFVPGGAYRVGNAIALGAVTVWRPAFGATSTFVWKRGNVVVSHNDIYSPTAADVGKRLTFTITISKEYWKSASQTITTPVIQAAAPTPPG